MLVGSLQKLQLLGCALGCVVGCDGCRGELAVAQRGVDIEALSVEKNCVAVGSGGVVAPFVAMEFY